MRRDRHVADTGVRLRGGGRYVPLVRTAVRRMRMTSASRSMSPLRNSTTSPNRSAHHDAKVTISRSRSGTASVSTASSATLAGRILWTRLARPAPTIRHGLASMISSLTAEPRWCEAGCRHAIAWWADLSELGNSGHLRR